jgi:putative intracellular protease/amidase
MQRFVSPAAEDSLGGAAEPAGDDKEGKRVRRARSGLVVTAAVVVAALLSAGFVLLELVGSEAAASAVLTPSAEELGIALSDPLVSADDLIDDPLVGADDLIDDPLDSADAAEAEAAVEAEAEAGAAVEAGALSPLPSKVRVKVFSGEGVSLRSLKNVNGVLRCFKRDLEVSFTGLITSSSLAGIGVLLVPGGSASKMLAAHKRSPVRATVREFVGSGGGYVGICAGANFALERWNGVGIANAKVRGTELGQAVLTRTELLKEQFDLSRPALGAEEAARTLDLDPSQSGVTVVAGGLFYANGPLFYNLPSEANSVVHRAGLPLSERRVLLRAGILTGPNVRGALKKSGSHTALVLSNRFESGRVVVSTVHPETFEGAGHGPSACDSLQARIVLNMVLHAAGRAPSWQADT